MASSDTSKSDRWAAEDEFEVAWYTKELGRPLQRKLLQRRFDEISRGHTMPAAHGDAADREERPGEPDRCDRAG